MPRKIDKSWILYGPQGSGKNRHAPAIAKVLGLSKVVEDWYPGQRAPTHDALVITIDKPDASVRRQISIDEAKQLLNIKD